MKNAKSRKYPIYYWIVLLIYTIAYVILCYQLYPTIVGKGSAEYKATENSIEINLGEWKHVVLKGYINEGEEQTEFEFETNSALISKEQILKEEKATPKSEIVVNSVQTYRFGSYTRMRIIFGVFLGIWGLILLLIWYVYEEWLVLLK